MRITQKQMTDLIQTVFAVYESVIFRRANVTINKSSAKLIRELIGIPVGVPRSKSWHQREEERIKDTLDSGAYEFCSTHAPNEILVPVTDGLLRRVTNALRTAWKAKQKSNRYPSPLWTLRTEIHKHFGTQSSRTGWNSRTKAAGQLAGLADKWLAGIQRARTLKKANPATDKFPKPSYVILEEDDPYTFVAWWPQDQRTKRRLIRFKKGQCYRIMQLVRARFDVALPSSKRQVTPKTITDFDQLSAKETTEVDRVVTLDDLKQCLQTDRDGNIRRWISEFNSYWRDGTNEKSYILVSQPKTPGVWVIQLDTLLMKEDAELVKQEQRRRRRRRAARDNDN